MAEIAGIFLSPFLQTFFERMASREFVDFFRQRKLNDGLLMRLKMTLLSANAVVEDAEDKQFTKPDVKVWLDELKDAVYDAENILDEIATKDLQRKLDAEFGNTACKVRNPISTSRFVKEVESKIKELLDRLDFLVKQKENIGLRGGVGGNPSERLPTTSLIEESSICGRDFEKETIINSLLSDDASGSEIGVIAIVGMGGIGKTTLAQLVYNDNRVKEHFDLEVWVCVSDDFDVFKVTKTIVERVTSTTYDTKDLDRLQILLREKLMKKKFLLVLDDVWNKKYVDWELLSNPFKFGAQGSKVVITACDSEVARVMFASETHRLMELPKEDCWSLFAKYAFHNGNSDARLELEALGRQIVEKCKGLPLAIKAIGALLRSKLDVDEWDKVLRSELWNLPIEETGILPALRLSYKYLPSHLKRCFAYCSIFPKDYAFKKDQLVLLWMAEGFLPQLENKTMEEVGGDFFLTLVSTSLFQQSSGDEYIMHDLANDLAKFISKQFSLSLEDDSSHEIGSKTRHLSYFSQSFDINKKFEALHRGKRLRTVIELNFFMDSSVYRYGTQFLLPMIRCLRVLILSHYGDLSELPDSIGKIIHLRYLDLSSTWIKRLPDSVCKLCNLQTLNLSHCRDLATLPRDMHQLINLRHLDITGAYRMKDMPLKLGRLKCLQTLSTFILSKNSTSCIRELQKLTNLRRSLSILELQNVESPTNAKYINTRYRNYLEQLVLAWNRDTNTSDGQITVQLQILDSLKPHTNLKSLAIKYYGGKSFSNWVGHPSFSNMASLRLENCKYCCSLPQLGQLPSLQDLSIVGLDGVVTVGREFYGSGSSSMKPFGALKVLRLENMLKWEKWISFDNENGGGAFPQLEELYICICPKLARGLPVYLPCLAKLEIRECPQLVAALPRAYALCELLLINCDKVLLNELPTGIEKLEIQRLDALEFLFWGGQPTLKTLTIESCRKLELPTNVDYSSIEDLMLDRCDSLKSFPLDLFPKLRRLEIRDCGNLESLTVREQHEQDLLLSLIDIDINGCPNFVCFPKGGLYAPNLKDFWVTNCGSLLSLPEKMNMLLSSLETLSIYNCPEVESFPDGGLPSNLKLIAIIDCEKLFASRTGWGLQNLLSVRTFKIGGKYEDMESFSEVGLLPANLTYLRIECFPNLKSLDKEGLQHLTSLQRLLISNCPELKCMPEDGLPASLSTLRIYECPLLKKEWQTKKGKEWRKIAHIPCKYIDGNLIK
ncbi:putative disease resistance RPP13-like protein 1 [Alnus glutinosa]|uniref:putative disease resistance RPP13-like protein 1 n=1 Tax=Alnus glutinosa TaxID=3517 RepID=UPI002D79D303|nr:putative disease resistance RPP13-like protein 1 [Alnus glutinosa]XP_062173915.1 putative disease resistance RPP13-like protein 1 [Alnus glutinosa]XP_062173916.1 putative disease resistance RPP13-like protein 1 [Alnus glutinosa]XP_062173918.1 putative disease resistance RPP13-like protein 1 [Alnus glutinosa]XP_062173919.1 putative disease resistance RPP13-like protein 1 [Alnus glutinosa]XP_062173920.1 putative disease resistance RPP13-like protein 1 [Alnus glutinosa]XP_062173921.1 putative